MDLADKLIQRKSKKQSDQFGIPIPDDAETNIDYACLHIIKHNPKLYIKNDQIYDNHTPVEETLPNCVRYAHRHFRSMDKYGYILIWQRLHELLPRFSEDKIVITPHLAFNRVTGELEHSEKPYLTIN